MLDITSILCSSLDLRAVMTDLYGPLRQLVSADYGALAVSGMEVEMDVEASYEWIVAELPGPFFEGYAEMAPHDFVHSAVTACPNVVLRDSEMIGRQDLERNMMYHRARELGAPLEQVMAVMLHVGELRSGLALYRERRRPFSERERALLQLLVPAMRDMVANCRTLRQVAHRGTLFEALLETQEVASLVVTMEGRVVERTATAARILAEWFAPVGRSDACLPRPLLDELSRIASLPPALRQHEAVRISSRAGAGLLARFVRLSVPRGLWAVLLREVPHEQAIPGEWRALLTAREQEVVAGVLRGWSNAVIAEDLKCAEMTVKTHLYRVFNKIGVSSRAALLHAAGRHR